MSDRKPRNTKPLTPGRAYDKIRALEAAAEATIAKAAEKAATKARERTSLLLKERRSAIFDACADRAEPERMLGIPATPETTQEDPPRGTLPLSPERLAVGATGRRT